MPAPDDDEVLRLTALIARRTRSLLERRSLGTEADPQHANPLSEDDPGMVALLARSVGRRIAVGSNTGRPVVLVGDWVDPESLDAFESPRTAMVSGFSVHANIAVEARDRMRLVRLLRYAARPAVSTDRLSELPDGRLHYRLKRPWRDGTTAVVFERQDFIAKLAALAPGAACPPDAVSRGAGSGCGVEVRDHPSRECSIRGHRNKLEDSHREIRGINLFRCTR